MDQTGKKFAKQLLIILIFFGSFFVFDSISALEIYQNTILNEDVNGMVIIGENNIILDCNGHKISGTSTGPGIILQEQKTGVTIKNCEINNFFIGIDLEESSGNNFLNNKIIDNYYGILSDCSSDNVFSDNLLQDNHEIGIYFRCFSSGSDNLVYHTNFIDNSAQLINHEGDEFFDNGFPEGGNYWSDYDTSEEGCFDDDLDGFCDSPYAINGTAGGQDNFPFVRENGWTETPTIGEWSFAIITDLHIGRGYDDYDETAMMSDTGEGEDYYLTERLKKVVDWLVDNKNMIDCEERKCPVKFLAVLGDITESAKESEFLKAKDILDKLNDPNGDGSNLDGIPYVPVFGNHDIGSVGSSPTTGEEFFDEIFWDENSTNMQLLEERLNFVRDEANPNYKNFAMEYGGMNFIGLDFNSREPVFLGEGVSSAAVLNTINQNWLETCLDQYKNNPTIIFSHDPIISNSINGFSFGEFNRIKTIFENKDILANFGGHIHGFENFLRSVDLFINANKEYPSINEISILTTESLMVSGNEENIDNKGIIRIVKIEDDSIDYSEIDGEFPALNPKISFDYKIIENELYPCVFFKANLFTKRDYSLFWDFDGEGTGSGETEIKCFPYPGEYHITLTATDEETGEEEFITRMIWVEEDIIPKKIEILEEMKDKMKMISTELGENLTEFGRTMMDTVMVIVSHSPSTPVGLLTIHFEDAEADVDMTGLVADFDLEQRKSVLYMESWPDVVEEQKVLLIPSTGSGSIYICPYATLLEEVNQECENKITLKVGETINGLTLTTGEYDGKEYYMVYGITGTGGGEMEGGSGEETDGELETQIAITEMLYGETDILNEVTMDVGDKVAPLLLSELKDTSLDLEDYTEEEFDSGETKKLKMKFKFLETAGNEYQEKNINIKFKFEAKQ
ncbi:MAG: NosD domain-containing protein [Candidatus Gottesmanbacteria bacterium]